MKVSKDNLRRLAATLGKPGQGVVMEPGDGEMTVPPTILPVAELCAPIVRRVVSASDIYTDSISVAASGNLSAAVPIDIRLITLDAGIYRLEGAITTYVASAGTGTPVAELFLMNPDGIGIYSFGSLWTGPVGIQSQRSSGVPFHFPDPGWYVRVIAGPLGGTGAGQWIANIYGCKLI